MSLTFERILLAVLSVAVVVLLIQSYQFKVELEHMISIVVVAGVLWLLYDGYKAYRGSAGSVMQRLAAAFHYSATILWARMVMVFGLLMTGGEWIASIVGEPNVAASISTFASAKVAGSLLVGSAVMTEIARRRKGSQDPVVAAAGTAPLPPPVAPPPAVPPGLA